MFMISMIVVYVIIMTILNYWTMRQLDDLKTESLMTNSCERDRDRIEIMKTR